MWIYRVEAYVDAAATAMALFFTQRGYRKKKKQGEGENMQKWSSDAIRGEGYSHSLATIARAREI